MFVIIYIHLILRLDTLKLMTDRIKDMRKALRDNLEKIGAIGTWNHITDQIGMFSYTGLSGKIFLKKVILLTASFTNFKYIKISVNQVHFLRDKYHIYMLDSGRINICGLNTNNVNYVAEAIKDALNVSD